jgi:hypoxanthine phosphoribosyltransferase
MSSKQEENSMDSAHLAGDLEHVLLTEEQLIGRIQELADTIHADYPDEEVLFVGVLKGAVMVMADLARAMPRHVEMDWMAVSSYGSGTTSSGVVRILKDLDANIEGRHVILVEDILDSGLTLTWLIKNLGSRKPKSIEVFTLLRKPDAMKVPVNAKYVGFDIPNEFVVGYGLDYSQKYRNLRCVATLAPHVYTS